MMKPLIARAYNEVREEHGLALKTEEGESSLKGKGQQQKIDSYSAPPNIQTSVAGHLSLFNQHCQQKGLNVDWRYCDVPSGTKSTPIWTVEAMINGEFAASGQGHTKKTARNEAAKKALRYLGVALVLCIPCNIQCTDINS